MPEQTEDQMARALIDHVKRTHTPRLALLEDRITAVLEYMDQVERGEPTRVALSHVRAFLNGDRDSILAGFLPGRTEPPAPPHEHAFVDTDPDSMCAADRDCTLTWREYRTRAL